MTNQNMPSTPSDPRVGFAVVTAAVRALIDATPESALGDPTPCDDFAVSDLLDHFVFLMRRIATIGDGRHWSTVEQEIVGSEHGEAFGSAAHDVMSAWSDDSKLGQEFEVPWGAMPGAPILFMYTGELAVHGWDLAEATGQEFAIADDLLEGALFATKQIPAGGRDEIPFGPVVDVDPEASVVEQMAGWLGRRVA